MLYFLNGNKIDESAVRSVVPENENRARIDNTANQQAMPLN